MALARLNLVIQDEDGNIIDGATITVQRELGGLPLAQLYSDRDGATPIGNPFTAADGADAGFHVVGGAYKITATKDAFTRIWRYVAIGTAGEVDSNGFTPRGEYDTGSPGTEYRMLDIVTDQSSSWLYINQTPSTGNPPPTLPTQVNDHWQLLASGGVTSVNGETGDVILDIREILSGDRTYYVRTDGSDSNTGLVDSAGGAFLTIQKAIDTVYNLDLNAHSVTIQVRDGTYTDNAYFPRPFLGGSVSLTGNTTTPANCVISFTGSSATGERGCVDATDGANVSIGGFKFTTATAGYGIAAFRNAIVGITGKMDFGTCVDHHMGAQSNARITIGADYTISGGAATHMIAQQGGYILGNSNTVTLSGTPAFSTAFAFAETESCIERRSVTWSGSATGTRFLVRRNSMIDLNGAAESTLPGNAVGTKESGGIIYGTENPSFRVSKSGNQTISDNTFTDITWDTEASDVGGYFSSDAWVPPAGLVELSAFSLLGGTYAGGAQCAIRFTKNGSSLVQYTTWAVSTSGVFVSCYAQDRANGTDSYKVQIIGDVSSGSVTVNSGANSGFSGAWQGP